MRILLTNDDGILASGIAAFYSALKQDFDITIVAPNTEQSSIGHAITLRQPLFCKKIYKADQFFGYSVTGTPADCVKFAISEILSEKPDLIVSGINLGGNDGCSVFYSGTVAAAREGALVNIPAIAVSLDTFTESDFSVAVDYGVKIVNIFKEKRLADNTFLNVNVPNKSNSDIKGLRFTKQCRIPIHGTFDKRKNLFDKDYYWMSGKPLVQESDMQIDSYALKEGYVTVTPIHTDATNYNFLEEMNNTWGQYL